VFSLTPPTSPGGAWTETVIDFLGSAVYPEAGVAIGNGGVLFATTRNGGTTGGDEGAVLSLTPPATPGGHWSQTVLWNFGVGGGYQPTASVAIGSGGALFGTASRHTGSVTN